MMILPGPRRGARTEEGHTVGTLFVILGTLGAFIVLLLLFFLVLFLFVLLILVGDVPVH